MAPTVPRASKSEHDPWGLTPGGLSNESTLKSTQNSTMIHRGSVQIMNHEDSRMLERLLIIIFKQRHQRPVSN